MPPEVALGRASDEERLPAFSLVLGSDYSLLSKVAAGETEGFAPGGSTADGQLFPALSDFECDAGPDQRESRSNAKAAAQLISCCATMHNPELPHPRKKTVHHPATQSSRHRRRTAVHLRELGRYRRERPDPTSPSTELLHASLNVLSAQVLIVDASGAIVASNLAAQRFASQNGLSVVRPGCRTVDLFKAWAAYCPQASAIDVAVASLIAGADGEFRMRYRWYAGEGAQWFDLRASRHECGEEEYVVIASEDITAHVEAEQTLGEAAEHQLRLQESERQVIAQELHDSTAQHIVAAALNLVGLKGRLEHRSDVLEFLERVEASLDEACKELRSFTYLLHPPCLEADGLASAVRRYVDGFGTRTGVRARVRIDEEAECLPDDLQRPLLRVIQEALGNVHRHASATRVAVWFRRIRGCLHLIVVDNGCGMATHAGHSGWSIAEPAGRGVGIPSIRARLRQFGGKLVIKSGDRGTMLHAVVPIRSASGWDHTDISLHRTDPLIFGAARM